VGAFGRVHKVKHEGNIYALKVMDKKQLDEMALDAI